MVQVKKVLDQKGFWKKMFEENNVCGKKGSIKLGTGN